MKTLATWEELEPELNALGQLIPAFRKKSSIGLTGYLAPVLPMTSEDLSEIHGVVGKVEAAFVDAYGAAAVSAVQTPPTRSPESANTRYCGLVLATERGGLRAAALMHAFNPKVFIGNERRTAKFLDGGLDFQIGCLVDPLEERYAKKALSALWPHIRMINLSFEKTGIAPCVRLTVDGEEVSVGYESLGAIGLSFAPKPVSLCGPFGS